MQFRQSVLELIPRRFSCRTYAPEPIGAEERSRLEQAAAEAVTGPLGGRMRFRLIAAAGEDSQALRGLGTYGFIRGASGYLAGAVRRSEKHLEEYGFVLERLILLAAEMDLGTCWLGGSFTHSTFAAKISLEPEEELPAVAAAGRMADTVRDWRERIRTLAGSDRRLSWSKLFFDDSFSKPMDPGSAGPFARPLEMVRLGPSASNKQPWRMIRRGNDWHLFLQRTPGYRNGLIQRAMRLSDLQRVDMGIAMCHFELSARELGLRGGWIVRDPGIEPPDGAMEYIVSWAIRE
jgi:nitroreductase